ncbi:hypothetical protein C0J52_08110 [Blattella germanica]|nr:hypothetical protein C0J52_08110 [Blattella germanica]
MAEGSDCTCQCLSHLPVFREDLHICIDDIHGRKLNYLSTLYLHLCLLSVEIKTLDIGI